MAKMLAHPTRRRILMIVAERVASPREIAEDLGEPVGRVSHHVRWLATREYLELVRTEPRRGAVEHFYRSAAPPVLSDAAWRRLPAVRRSELAAALVRDIWSDVLDAGDAGAFAAKDMHLSRTRVELDEQGRRELAQALENVVQTALRAHEESAARRGDRPGRRSELAVLHFDVG
jgi:DNA-binding transcriptional ArsR family regulator